MIRMSHLKTGSDGEKMAADFLRQEGYVILHRNWKTGHKEIDIIAEHRGIIVFVEVKTRTGTAFGYPEEAVRSSKKKYLTEAASLFLEENGKGREIRFDVISIVNEQNISRIFHIKDAFAL